MWPPFQDQSLYDQHFSLIDVINGRLAMDRNRIVRLSKLLTHIFSRAEAVSAQISERQQELGLEQGRIWSLLGKFRDELTEHLGALDDICAE